MNAGREKRQFWAIVQGLPEKVEGLSTPEPIYWFVPSLGQSLATGHHLFAERYQCVAKCLEIAYSELLSAQGKISRLKELT